MADKDLYKACAVEVKRQIWQDNQALFGDEVSPLLKQYILEKENILFSNDISVLHNFFSPSPKTRRQGEVRTRKPLTTCSWMEFIGLQSTSLINRVSISPTPEVVWLDKVFARNSRLFSPTYHDESNRNYFNSYSTLCNN